MTSDTWTFRKEASSASVELLRRAGPGRGARPRLLAGSARSRTGAGDLAQAHQHGAEAQHLVGGGGEDGRALAEEELGLLVRPLQDQHAGAAALMQEGQEVGHLEAGEVALEDLFHEAAAEIVARALPCYPGRHPPHGIARRSSVSASARLLGPSEEGQVTTFKELIRQVKPRSARSRRRKRARSRGRGPCSSTCGRPTSGRRATCPAPSSSRAASWSCGSRRRSPTSDQEVVVYCAGGTRSALGGASRCRTSATRTSRSMPGGFGRWKEAGLPHRGPADADRRAEGALQPAPAGARGRRGRTGAGCSTRRCCSWARAAWARPPASTWPRRAWARSASSTPTWWTSRTCSARSCTRTRPWDAQDGVGGGHASARSTPT